MKHEGNRPMFAGGKQTDASYLLAYNTPSFVDWVNRVLYTFNHLYSIWSPHVEL
jgi:hypothetical protein